MNCDINGDGTPDKNIDNNGDGKCDTNCSVDPNNAVDIISNDGYILYITYNKPINAEDIIPGWTDKQILTVNNKSDKSIVYSIKLLNVTNTFNPTSEFVYSIYRNNIMIKNETATPVTEDYIMKDLIIPANTSYSYEIGYKFIDTGVEQNNQMGKTFKATVTVEADKIN